MEKLEENIKKALIELRKEKERKFDQTVDLIINLQKFDLKKNQINLFVSVPFKIKNKKICGFFEVKNKDIETITPEQFKKYSDKKALKKLVKNFDFFIAEASLMPKVATTFGRVLGPAGKMPSPKLGIIKSESGDEIKKAVDKFGKIARIRSKEPSLKFCIGKESMKDEDISENIITAYNSIINSLPRKKENIRSVMIKLTMGKPVKLEI